MATDRELWALVLQVERDHGENGPLHIVKRIGEASLAGDRIGVDLWKAVAVRYDRLLVRASKRDSAPTG